MIFLFLFFLPPNRKEGFVWHLAPSLLMRSFLDLFLNKVAIPVNTFYFRFKRKKILYKIASSFTDFRPAFSMGNISDFSQQTASVPFGIFFSDIITYMYSKITGHHVLCLTLLPLVSPPSES